MSEHFRALRSEKDDTGFSFGFRELSLDDLLPGELLIKVEYSSVNYKDGLASIPGGNVVRRYPLIPGIDLAGTVVASEDGGFREGDAVIATGYDIGVSHHGGFAEYARIPAAWAVPLPKGLSLRDAMAIGTAGFTAAQAIQRLEENGLRPGQGPVLVTGATGGVGCLAIDMLAQRGYEVEASTGKESEHEFLRSLGAREIFSRAEVGPENVRALDRQRWAAAIDPVGGNTLAYALSRLLYGGSVASVGLTGGVAFPGSVFPFILRSANLLGIDSAYVPMEARRLLWERLSGDLRPAHLDELTTEVGFDGVPEMLSRILAGGVRGRIVVHVGAA